MKKLSEYCLVVAAAAVVVTMVLVITWPAGISELA